jgi:hypothetical protein
MERLSRYIGVSAALVDPEAHELGTQTPIAGIAEHHREKLEGESKSGTG